MPFNQGVVGDFENLTNLQLWNQYRLAIGGRLVPASAIADPDVAGALLSAEDVPFVQPAVQVRTDTPYQWADLQRPHDAKIAPVHITTPAEATNFVGHVMFGGILYDSTPRNLHRTWNIVQFTVAGIVRGVPVLSDYSA